MPVIRGVEAIDDDGDAAVALDDVAAKRVGDRVKAGI
jgi:hypothetical protein